MGPWFIRDHSGPWRPGCSIETLRELIRRGKVTADTILRGPGTKQFWNFAGRTPSIANLLGVCHNCRAGVKPDDYSCKTCGAVFTPDPDRQHLGLAPVHILPGEASPEIVATACSDTPAPVPVIAPPTPVFASPAKPPPDSAPASRAERRPVAKSGSRATGWLVAATVVVLVGMGVVLALVASGKLTIPGLNDTPIAAAPTNPPKAPPSAPTETASKQEPKGEASPEPKPEPSKPAESGISGPTTPEATRTPTGSVAGTESVPPAPTEAQPVKGAPEQFDLQAVLVPLFKAEPFDLAAIDSKIDSLRKEHPGLSAELDSWSAAAKTRAEQIRLRKIP
jgi:hypothetical protein